MVLLSNTLANSLVLGNGDKEHGSPIWKLIKMDGLQQSLFNFSYTDNNGNLTLCFVPINGSIKTSLISNNNWQ